MKGIKEPQILALSDWIKEHANGSMLYVCHSFDKGADKGDFSVEQVWLRNDKGSLFLVSESITKKRAPRKRGK